MKHDSTFYTSATGYGAVRVVLLRETRIASIEKAVEAFDQAQTAAAQASRKLDAARAAAQSFDDLARAEAMTAGATGQPFDAAAVAKRRAATMQVAEDLELEVTAARSHVGTTHAAYQQVLATNLDAVRKLARDEAADCALRLTTALEMTRGAQTRLDAAVVVLAGASELAAGMQIPGNAAPRTSADAVDDAGYPNVLAGVAADELERTIGWLSRWQDRATEQEEARKAATKAAKKAAADAEKAGA